MLVLETSPDIFVEITSPTVAINNVEYVVTSLQLWPDLDLATIGVFRPVEDSIPDGKRSVSYVIQRENGVVRVIHTLEDIPVSSEDVSNERDRRIALGFTAQTSGSQSVPVDTRNTIDFRNINGLCSAAIVRQMQANTTSFVFRGSDNLDYTLTPSEMIEVGMQALAHVDRQYKKSWILKSTSPIPVDYKNDSYWI